MIHMHQWTLITSTGWNVILIHSSIPYADNIYMSNICRYYKNYWPEDSVPFEDIKNSFYHYCQTILC